MGAQVPKTKKAKRYRSPLEIPAEKPKIIKIQPKKKLNPAGKSIKSAKLSKSDPDYFSKIGTISAEKRIRKHGTQYFTDMAKLSHPRAQYNGGRPKKVAAE